jgi:hypothetical protein
MKKQADARSCRGRLLEEFGAKMRLAAFSGVAIVGHQQKVVAIWTQILTMSLQFGHSV